MKKNIPSVVIVGRMNVGKSTLFNRLSESARAITYDYAGVTRDIITDTVCWRDHCFELVDTGGISTKAITTDVLAEEVRSRAVNAVTEADVIIFVLDSTVGVTSDDRDLARFLHKSEKPIIVVANKSDAKQAQEHQYEFERLGFKTVVSLSAQHGTGIADLFDAILEALPRKVEKVVEESSRCNIIIMGKPNVGKSSLLNLLLKKDRAIVADMPGTTREPIKEELRFFKETIQVTDTPGLRRKRGVTEPLEKLMVKSALSTVEEADVVLLVIDAREGRLVDQELKLAFYLFQERYKGLIILFNKDDLVDEAGRSELKHYLEPYQYFLKKVVQMRTSAVSLKNVGKIMQKASDVCKRYQQRFSDKELTMLFKEALQRKPLYRAQQRLAVFYVHQIHTRPITIELVVNAPQWFGPSQLGFFDAVLRDHADLTGVPVKFLVRKK